MTTPKAGGSALPHFTLGRNLLSYWKLLPVALWYAVGTHRAWHKLLKLRQEYILRKDREKEKERGRE